MDTNINNIAKLFVANGYGLGKYWSGYIFAKDPKARHFFYIAESKMAILSAGLDQDGEKSILETFEIPDKEKMETYFHLDYNKKSNIDWIGATVHIVLKTSEKEKEKLKNYITYYMWPAVKIDFPDEMMENSIVVYERTFDKKDMEKLKQKAEKSGISDKVEYWSMVKMLAMGDRFGELAPKVCMEVILRMNKKKQKP